MRTVNVYVSGKGTYYIVDRRTMPYGPGQCYDFGNGHFGFGCTVLAQHDDTPHDIFRLAHDQLARLGFIVPFPGQGKRKSYFGY